MAWTDIRQWFEEENRFIALGYDSITLYTGEEGAGKSYTMLARHAATDPGFTVERVHFDQDPFMEQARHLQPGDAIQLDEWRGHKRMAMHGHRMAFLEYLKERRALGLRIGIGFPHVSQMDDDILRQRTRYWAHKPSRHELVVRSRVAKTLVDGAGKPYVQVRWPIRGRFPVPDIRGRLVEEYKPLKEAFTRRAPEAPKASEGDLRFFKPELAQQAVATLRSQLGLD